MNDILVRQAHAADFDQWAALYRGYREFYKYEPDDAVVERVWGWIRADEHEVSALVAVDGDRLVGLGHFRRFPRPASGTVGIYLDDLFVDPTSRGRGVARAILAELSALADRDGCSVVRWITAEDNATARRLYDSVATATKWVTYDLRPGSL